MISMTQKKNQPQNRRYLFIFEVWRHFVTKDDTEFPVSCFLTPCITFSWNSHFFPHYRLRVKQTHLWSKSSFASQRTPDKNQSQQENNSKNISFPYIHCFSSLPFSHLCLLSDLPCSSAALLLSTWGSLSQIKNTPKFTRKVPLMHTSVTAKPCFVLLKKHVSSYKVIHTSRSAALVVALHCGSGITVPVCQTHAYISLEYCLMQWEIAPHYAGFDAIIF